MKPVDLVALAAKLYDQFDYKKRNEGTSEEKTIVIIKDNAEDYKKLVDLTYFVNSETSLSMDSTCQFTMQALGLLADSEAKNEDELSELEPEADVYTGELTAWLAENVNHVYYLTEALETFSDSDGFQALTMAQYLAKREVLTLVVRFLEENE